MKHILVLLFMLAAYPCQAAEATAEAGTSRMATGDAPADSGTPPEKATTVAAPEKDKKPAQGDEEEPDCD